MEINETETINVAIYARQSSGSEQKSPSIEVQIEKCEELANKYGYNVVATFDDGNIKGRTYPNYPPDALKIAQLDKRYQKLITHLPKKKQYRKKLGMILKLIEEKEINLIVTFDNARLMRPKRRTHLESYLMEFLVENNIVLHTVHNGIIDYSDDTDDFMQTVESRVEDKALDLGAEKSINGVRKKRNNFELWNTNVTGSYGYKTEGKQKVKVIPEQAEVVREVFKKFNSGVPIMAIVKELNDRGEPTRTGEGVWRQDSIKNMLRRHIYTGYDYDTEGKRDLIKPLMDFEKEEDQKNIIEWEDFEQAKKIFELNKKSGYQTRKPHPLTACGIYCGYCKNKLVIASRGDYECKHNNYIKSKSDMTYGCGRSRIKESETDRQTNHGFIKNGLLDAITPFCVIGLMDKLKSQKDSKNLEMELTKINNELVDIDNLEEELTDDLFKGNKERARKMFKKYEDRRKVLILKQQEVLDAIRNSKVKITEKELSKKIEAIKNNQCDSIMLKELLPKVINYIEVYAYFVRITLKNGCMIELDRIPVGRARTMPLVDVDVKIRDSNIKSVVISYLNKSFQKEFQLTHKPNEIHDTKMLYYIHDNAFEIYRDGVLKIQTVGINPEPYGVERKGNVERLKEIPAYVMNPDDFDLPDYILK